MDTIFSPNTKSENIERIFSENIATVSLTRESVSRQESIAAYL